MTLFWTFFGQVLQNIQIIVILVQKIFKIAWILSKNVRTQPKMSTSGACDACGFFRLWRGCNKYDLLHSYINLTSTMFNLKDQGDWINSYFTHNIGIGITRLRPESLTRLDRYLESRRPLSHNAFSFALHIFHPNLTLPLEQCLWC